MPTTCNPIMEAHSVVLEIPELAPVHIALGDFCGALPNQFRRVEDLVQAAGDMFPGPLRQAIYEWEMAGLVLMVRAGQAGQGIAAEG